MYNNHELQDKGLHLTTSGLTFDFKSYMIELDDSELESLSGGGDSLLDRVGRTVDKVAGQVKDAVTPDRVEVNYDYERNSTSSSNRINGGISVDIDW
jgi:hypothetical protein